MSETLKSNRVSSNKTRIKTFSKTSTYLGDAVSNRVSSNKTRIKTEIEISLALDHSL